MVLRVVHKEGPHKGKKLWGCRDFPRCRGLREYVPEAKS
jgi:ssDNA-binding Zn-finger/Zn-ribbon topoisomerase 1